jgi:hypothetical protein
VPLPPLVRLSGSFERQGSRPKGDASKVGRSRDPRSTEFGLSRSVEFDLGKMFSEDSSPCPGGQ